MTLAERQEVRRGSIAPLIPRVVKRLYEIQESLYRAARDGLMPADRALGLAFALGRDFERTIALYRRCVRPFPDPSDEELTADIEAEFRAVLSILVSAVATACLVAVDPSAEDEPLRALGSQPPPIDPDGDLDALLDWMTGVKRGLQTMRPLGGDADDTEEAGFGRVEMMMDDEERWLAAYGAY